MKYERAGRTCPFLLSLHSRKKGTIMNQNKGGGKMKVWQHFKTITRHKWLVFQGCARVGLYWQGITHDLSK